MRHIKGVGIGLISFVALFLLIGLILPSSQIVHRDFWIKTNSINVYKSFQEPNSWMALFPMLSELKDGDYDFTEKGINIHPSKGKLYKMELDSLMEGYAKISQAQLDIKGIEIDYVFTWAEPDSKTVRMNIDTEYHLGSNPFYRFLGIGFNDIMDGDLKDLIKQMKSEIED